MKRQTRRLRRVWQWSVAATMLLAPTLLPAATVETNGLSEEQAESVRILVEQVSQIRQLPILHPIRVNVMSLEELQAILRREIDSQMTPERLEGQTLALQTLGLAPPGYDLRAGYEAMITEQIGGLYDDDEETLHILEWFNLDSSTARIILAHEITHALQDQSFDLGGSPLFESDNDDQALATLAIAEGDATVSMSEWAAMHGGAGFIFEMTQLLQMDQTALVGAPPFVSAQLLFPYLVGQTFVMPLRMGPRGWEEVNDMLRHWPESTEQILHPERSLANPESVDHPTPVEMDAAAWGVPEDWDALESNVAGEFTLRHVFQRSLRSRRAAQVANGWDGDRFEVRRNMESGATAFLWSTVWDTEAEAVEFETALGRLWENIDLTTVMDTSQGPAYASPEIAVERVGGTVHLAVWDAAAIPEIALPEAEIDLVE